MAHARHRSISCLVLIKLRRVYSRSKKTVKSEFYFAIRTCERALSLALPAGGTARPRPPCKRCTRTSYARCHAHDICWRIGKNALDGQVDDQLSAKRIVSQRHDNGLC